MLRKIRKMLKSQEGFTLVELMIVVVILGILAGVGIQQYGAVTARARQAAHEANIKVLTSAANMYLMMENPTEALLISPITNATEDNPLTTAYLDEWPMNPHSNARDYIVTITIEGGEAEGDEAFYSVSVSSPYDED